MPALLSQALSVLHAASHEDIPGHAHTPLTHRGSFLAVDPLDRSAAYDASMMGRLGIHGLVSANNAAELLRLTALQAARQRKITQVASIRSSESYGVVDYLTRAAKGDGLIWQIADGEGFARNGPDDQMGGALGAAGGLLKDAAGGGFAKLKSLRKGGKSKKGSFKGGFGALKGLAAGALGGGGGGGGVPGADQVDLPAYEIHEMLQKTIDWSRKAALTAAELEETVQAASAKANASVGATAELLNLPGFPPEGLRRPPPAKGFGERPADLPPAMMDFLGEFVRGPRKPGILKIADPYRMGDVPQPPGRKVHDFFGSPPLPKQVVPKQEYTQAGMAGMSGSVKGL
eukprot:TRINITY_DN82607_c0_g1_i1.p1 TRINITY_DN82607_c0_g1~~TRINITY_DN82607_c0_g1_i1.p1  ORF type:complete len:367 (+),score=79.50 TRINITY_DN82607_c0_g1_i1:67-1101(+)